MTALCKSIIALAAIGLGTLALAGQDVVTIRVGEPISSEASSTLGKFKKCGSEGETHAAQDGRSSTTTWIRSYRSPESGVFIQVVTTNDAVERIYWQQARSGEEGYWDTEFQQVAQMSISASTMQVTSAVPVEPKKKAEQGSAGQPATRPESKPEGGEKPQPEAEGRSR